MQGPVRSERRSILGPPRRWPCGPRQGRVVTENRLFELGHRRARGDAELIGEQAVQPRVAPQRVGLRSRAVEGDHQLTPEPLLERVLGHDALELADEGSVTTGRQVGVDPVTEGTETRRGEPRRLRGHEGQGLEPRQRRAPPQIERGAQQRLGAAGLVGAVRGARPGHEAVERGDVDLDSCIEHVTVVGSTDAVALGAEGAPQAVHEPLQAGRPVAWGVVTPEVVYEPFAGHRLSAVQCQASQQCSFEGPRERDDRTVGVDLNRTEQSDGDHRHAP